MLHRRAMRWWPPPRVHRRPDAQRSTSPRPRPSTTAWPSAPDRRGGVEVHRWRREVRPEPEPDVLRRPLWPQDARGRDPGPGLREWAGEERCARRLADIGVPILKTLTGQIRGRRSTSLDPKTAIDGPACAPTRRRSTRSAPPGDSSASRPWRSTCPSAQCISWDMLRFIDKEWPILAAAHAPCRRAMTGQDAEVAASRSRKAFGPT